MSPLALTLERLFAQHPNANQTELAHFVGITPQAVQQWMAGKTYPSKERLQRVADFFGINTVELERRLMAEEVQNAATLLKEALEREGWSVTPLRDQEPDLPAIFRGAGVVPNLKAQRGTQTLYFVLRSRSLGKAAIAQHRRLLSLAQRAGNLIVLEPGEWSQAVSKAKAWFAAQQDAKQGEWLCLSHLGDGEASEDGCVPSLICELALARQEAWALLGRRDLAGLKLLSMRGDAMAPTLNPRDLLFVDTSVTAFKGDGIYAFLLDGNLLVRRLQRLPGGRITIKGDNPSYEARTLENHHEINITGQIVAALPMRFSVFA